MKEVASVELAHVVKRYGEVIAVNDLRLVIGEGEFFSLLGPSGCGKTTTLRLIGGLETPDSGEILISGEIVNDRPPYERSSNIVFQNYALFPHLSVNDNIAFGLRLKSRRTPEPEVKKLVAQALELVHLEDFGTRRPNQLSGGQQQRVALARALILHPKVLLLDEPLGALDRKLRKTMQIELRRIQREVNITFVYVTHDQAEAMAVADRIALLIDGRLRQVGTPTEFFRNPADIGVARFLGADNFISGIKTGRSVDTAIGPVVVDAGGVADGPVVVTIRPAETDTTGGTVNNFRATVETSRFSGIAADCTATVGCASIRFVVPAHEQPAPGDVLTLHFPPRLIHVFADPSPHA